MGPKSARKRDNKEARKAWVQRRQTAGATPICIIRPFSPLKSSFFFMKPPKDKYKQSEVMLERWDLPFVVVWETQGERLKGFSKWLKGFSHISKWLKGFSQIFQKCLKAEMFQPFAKTFRRFWLKGFRRFESREPSQKAMLARAGTLPGARSDKIPHGPGGHYTCGKMNETDRRNIDTFT